MKEPELDHPTNQEECVAEIKTFVLKEKIKEYPASICFSALNLTLLLGECNTLEVI